MPSSLPPLIEALSIGATFGDSPESLQPMLEVLNLGHPFGASAGAGVGLEQVVGQPDSQSLGNHTASAASATPTTATHIKAEKATEASDIAGASMQAIGSDSPASSPSIGAFLEHLHRLLERTSSVSPEDFFRELQPAYARLISNVLSRCQIREGLMSDTIGASGEKLQLVAPPADVLPSYKTFLSDLIDDLEDAKKLSEAEVELAKLRISIRYLESYHDLFAPADYSRRRLNISAEP
ncbi:hypothetical protein PSEUBRA_002227 [Kalmanozyma brasiliensis GHG001]|uniref:uncharacterized protein n=1 Tax=Kalmanozyma brasiliensis (strain GHG001) TaxID=1365824 RepID=UPI0028682C10|nr:uncharacterized protein PSEUBRA_002227 [Kalmanozyma brasiliensis GHG001]KAF6767058.1 hypothetical protein PSEUBRA_002227 [Kalmanozyma brasiliensis GHG001]